MGGVGRGRVRWGRGKKKTHPKWGTGGVRDELGWGGVRDAPKVVGSEGRAGGLWARERLMEFVTPGSTARKEKKVSNTGWTRVRMQSDRTKMWIRMQSGEIPRRTLVGCRKTRQAAHPRWPSQHDSPQAHSGT